MEQLFEIRALDLFQHFMEGDLVRQPQIHFGQLFAISQLDRSPEKMCIRDRNITRLARPTSAEPGVGTGRQPKRVADGR